MIVNRMETNWIVQNADLRSMDSNKETSTLRKTIVHELTLPLSLMSDRKLEKDRMFASQHLGHDQGVRTMRKKEDLIPGGRHNSGLEPGHRNLTLCSVKPATLL